MTAAFVVYKTNYNTRFLPGYITMRTIQAGNLRFPQGAVGAQGLRASPSDPCDPSLN